MAARLQVGTVAQTVLDRGFVAAHRIALGPRIAVEAGPKGALVETWITKRVLPLSIDGADTPPAQPWVFDLAAYQSRRARRRPIDGSLGAEFMLANRAVIDFGAGLLFLRPADAAERG